MPDPAPPASDRGAAVAGAASYSFDFVTMFCFNAATAFSPNGRTVRAHGLRGREPEF